MKVVYVAHPLGAGPDRERNRQSAARWCGYITKHFNVATVADWVILSGEWDESPENRERGLRIDKALIERCDELWLVGGRVSRGMAIEAEHARQNGKRILDLTLLGRDPLVDTDWIKSIIGSEVDNA